MGSTDPQNRVRKSCPGQPWSNTLHTHTLSRVGTTCCRTFIAKHRPHSRGQRGQRQERLSECQGRGWARKRPDRCSRLVHPHVDMSRQFCFDHWDLFPVPCLCVSFWTYHGASLLQMLMEHEDKIMQVGSDVDVLKKNQMQLANTIQVRLVPCVVGDQETAHGAM